jgi:hypothetical protein
MRIAAIELYVEVSKRGSAQGQLSDGAAVLRALAARRDARNALALEAIEVAAGLAPSIILCPGWTFVGRAPRAATLGRGAGGAVVVFEAVEPPAEPRTLVLERGVVRELPAQTFATAAELEHPESAGPGRLAAALRSGRSVGDGVVLVCGEVNAVRRFVKAGERVRYAWDERVAAAGVTEQDLAGAVVLNPAHTPTGSYIRDKRRAGPWRALVSTANALDRARLGKAPLAPPAHAVMAGQDLVPAAEPVRVGERGSRVVVYDVPGA